MSLTRRIGLLATGLALASPAVAHATEVRMSASFTAGLRVSFQLSDTEGAGDVAPPLRHLVLHLPAGIAVHLAGIPTCPLATLRRGGCPRRSVLGTGHATMIVYAGSQTIPEPAALTAFRAPNRGGRQALELLGVGHSPLDQRSISQGVLEGDTSPYGAKLTISIPPIPTLEFEPDASFVSMSLTLGHAVVTPPGRCPGGGYPFAANFGFADSSTASAHATAPCR